MSSQPQRRDKIVQFQGLTYITVEALAELTGYCLPHLRRLAQAGTIPARKVGHRWYFNHTAVMAALSPQQQTQTQTPDEDGELIAGLIAGL